VQRSQSIPDFIAENLRGAEALLLAFPDEIGNPIRLAVG
jgi:hypothetical protein